MKKAKLESHFVSFVSFVVKFFYSPLQEKQYK